MAFQAFVAATQVVEVAAVAVEPSQADLAVFVAEGDQVSSVSASCQAASADQHAVAAASFLIVVVDQDSSCQAEPS